MSSFESNLAKMEQTLRRALTQEERRLLKLWDLTCQSAARGQQEVPSPPPVDQNTYSGRFKVVATKGYYEIYFVCAKLMLRPIEIDSRDGVIDFLMQDPICLDEGTIQQALAAADIARPMQVKQDVALTEPLLRSMGFRHVNG